VATLFGMWITATAYAAIVAKVCISQIQQCCKHRQTYKQLETLRWPARSNIHYDCQYRWCLRRSKIVIWCLGWQVLHPPAWTARHSSHLLWKSGSHCISGPCRRKESEEIRTDCSPCSLWRHGRSHRSQRTNLQSAHWILLNSSWLFAPLLLGCFITLFECRDMQAGPYWRFAVPVGEQVTSRTQPCVAKYVGCRKRHKAHLKPSDAALKPEYTTGARMASPLRVACSRRRQEASKNSPGTHTGDV
jgi:hypothetical protein